MKYFNLFHQDKFEAVNKAYDFLCSKSSKNTSGPNPENIVLILKAQSILFSRFTEGKFILTLINFVDLVKCYSLLSFDIMAPL